jgi:hypothetical protein
MNAWPNQDRAALCAFYGDPDANGDGLPDRQWEATNLTLIKPPYRLVLAWNVDQSVSVIRCHKKVAESLAAVLDAIGRHYGSQSAIEAARLHLYGGAYMFRLMRGAHQLSIHSWGAAIDLDPARNAFGRKWDDAAGMMPHAVQDIFAAEGWVWGGRWSTPDAMHFQAACV